MKAGRETAQFDFEVEHVAIDADFHHPKGRNLKLATPVIEAFEAQHENAEIFVQNTSGTAFSADEILNWFLLQTNTTLADHLPQEALQKALDTDRVAVLLTAPIRFEPGVFHMATEDGDQDLKGIKLMCKVTVQRKQG